MAFNRETFTIYDEEYHTGAAEEIQRAAIDLNEAAGNSMALTTQRMRGEFMRESFFKDIEGMIRDRDPNDLSDSTADDLTMGEEVSAKIHKSIHVEKTLNAFSALGNDARDFSFTVGAIQGKRMAVDYMDTAIASVSAAIRSEDSMKYDATQTEDRKTISPANLNRIKKRMGDQAQRVRAWVMDSTMLHDLVEENIESKITNVADVSIVTGTAASLGLPVIMTDSPYLLNEDPAGDGSEPDEHFVLGLTERAVEAIEAEERAVLAETVGGKANLVGRIQSEFAVINKVAGCAYTGGEHPTTADLADPSNWEFAVTDPKSGPGVMGVFNAIEEV